MSVETVTGLDIFPAPYGREITLENVSYDNGMRVLRIRIREGRRFTVVDVDEKTARHWAGVMAAWAGPDGGRTSNKRDNT